MTEWKDEDFDLDPEYIFGDALGDFDDMDEQAAYGELDNVAFINNSKIKSVAELFLEWFLLDSGHEKTIAEFLAEEKISEIITEQDFQDLISGDAILSESLCSYIAARNPFSLNLAMIVKKNRPTSRYPRVIAADELHLVEKTTEINQQRKIKRAESKREYEKQWYRDHSDEICAKWRERYESDPEFRARIRANSKKNARKYRALHSEKIKACREAYYAAHQTELLKKQREKFMHDAEYRKQRLFYAKEYRLKNLEYITRAQKEYLQRPDVKARKNARKRERYNQDADFAEKCRSAVRKCKENKTAEQKEEARKRKNASTAKYNQKNREKRIEYARSERRKELRNASGSDAKYREKHREEILAKKRLPETREKLRLLREKNRDAINARKQELYAEKQFAEKSAAISGILAGLVQNAMGRSAR